MFTGIIESQGKVIQMEREGTNCHFLMESSISPELKPDQSVSHDGVCLTVTKVAGQRHWVTAVDETLKKSSLGSVKQGQKLNLERSMVMNGRLDGHLVQGHVDQLGKCMAIRNEAGSWLFDFEYEPAAGNVTIEKGSIAVNGVSLTCFNSRKNSFTVAIIPYTYEFTNFNSLLKGSMVNLEFDVIGKYIRRLIGAQ